MRNKLFSTLLLIVLVTTQLFAQKMGDTRNLADPFEGRMARTDFQKIYVGTDGDMVDLLANHLSNEQTNFQGDEVSVELLAHTRSTVTEHYLFDQMYRGYKVFNGTIKINMDTKGTIRSVFDNSYNTENWDGSLLTAEAQSLAQLDLTDGLKSKLGYPDATLETQVVLAELHGKAFALLEVTLMDEASHAYRSYLVDAQLNVIYEHDLNSYHGTPTNATAYVFLPDPTVSANVFYGSPYIDSNNLEVPVLNAQRVQVNMVVDFDGTNYNLSNNYVTLDEYSLPNTAHATPVSNVFNYTRGDDRFEEVNAFYHLTTYNNYVRDSLGMTIGDFLVRFDAHALNGSDNSMYSRSGGNPSLFFGDGGVDDAEDADVVTHEYGHALSDNASPSSNQGFERQALDEGIGDYICSSYSRSISEFRWNDVFTWDGHNEYWDGRTSTVSTCYDPDNLPSSIHLTGQMWATALMEIWSAIGKIDADKLALQALYDFSPRMSMTDAAIVYEAADSLLFGGAYHNVIHPIFVNRCFFPGEVGINEVVKPNVTLANTEGFAFHDQAVMVISDKPIQSIELYDLTGKLVDQVQVANEMVTYYKAQLTSGVYIMNVTTSVGSAAHKLVKGN